MQSELEIAKGYLIKEVEIKKMWGTTDIKWQLDPEVNILVGINGSGKSTVLQTINVAIANNYNKLNDFYLIKDKIESVKASFFNDKSHTVLNKANSYNFFLNGIDCELISTFDGVINIDDREEAKPLKHSDMFPIEPIKFRTQLDVVLENIILKKSSVFSFTDYRLKAVNPSLSERETIEVGQRIIRFFGLVNNFFKSTYKTVFIDTNDNFVKFLKTRENKVVEIYDLSSGEKQLLIILFKVFLQEEKPFILLMDEPEVSLHVDWQHQLIGAIRELNPNCQLIIATHSPSIFGDGWADKISFMEDLVVKS